MLACMRAKQPKPSRKVAVSGGFDPLHIGHVRMFKQAKAYGDVLIVIVNNDNWLRDKKGFVFMPQRERVEMLRALPFVDEVVLTGHKKGDPDRSVSRALERVRPHVFANGGDRFKSNVPEVAVCKRLGIEMVFNIGEGGKVQSSSWMVRDVSRNFLRSVRPWGEFYGWDEGPEWKLKTLYIKPGKRLSLQYHRHRAELWVLVKGDATATIEANGKTHKAKLINGQLFAVPAHAMHRLESKRGATIVEIALGAFDEADIVRVKDDHGRA